MRIWFTSDTHFNHTNICRGESAWDGKKGTRDFDSIQKMNEAIWLSLKCIEPGDQLFHLGDVALCVKDKEVWARDSFVTWLPDVRVTFIRGNHDWGRKKDAVLSDVGAKVCDLWEGKLEDDEASARATLCHYPIVSWSKQGKGAFMLHGHCHGNLDKSLSKGRMMDVGWDVWARPISLKEVVEKLEKVAPFKSDHHGSGD